jgi:hypothetical protein
MLSRFCCWKRVSSGGKAEDVQGKTKTTIRKLSGRRTAERDHPHIARLIEEC